MAIKIENALPVPNYYLTYSELTPGKPYFSKNVGGVVYVKPQKSHINNSDDVLIYFHIAALEDINVIDRNTGREFYPAEGCIITIDGE